jgi:diguanylate cyclase (GGDEF)-like protein
MTDFQRLRNLAKEMSVLYVEDDFAIREEMRDFLTRFFPVVDLANDGEAGLKRYRDGSYDIVISDINMPRMNGIELAGAILAEHPEQSLVIISAYNEQEQLMQLINIGIEYYVLKPIDTEQLASVLCKIAESHHNRLLAQSHYEALQQKVRETSEKLKEQHYIDSMTGLPNLRRLMEEIKKVTAERKDFTILILIDIDRLQYINELYGTEAGNEVLTQFADFLNAFTEDKSYKVFRASGDQFVLMEHLPYIDTDKYETDLESLQERVHSLKIYLHEVDLPISIDVTIGMFLGEDKPYEHADMALRYAKESNKQFAVYNTLIDTSEQIKNDLVWKEKIKEAIRKDRVIPVYQPIVDQTGDIVKYESLMRISETRNDKLHLISPLFFLDTAVVRKQYLSLSNTLVGKVLKQALETGHTFSVNLSYEDIADKNFQQFLLQEITSKGIGEQIIFEITESETIKDYTIFNDFVKRSRHLGIRIAIDDFGSGYSNFKYILDMNPDFVKIDGSLIKHIDTDPHAMVLTRAITRFCHELGITVIAEYVHSEMIFNILKGFGVDEFQGYYFYQPMEKI